MITEAAEPRKTICIVVSTPLTIHALLRNQVVALSHRYRVCLAMNLHSAAAPRNLPDNVEIVHVPIEREISPWRDLRAVIALTRLFRRRRFDAVHSITPKAGLISAIAGAAAGIPLRFHTFTGQVWVTRSGLARRILKSADRVISLLDTHILVDGPLQWDFLIREGIVSRKNSRVLGRGSLGGVDLARFSPSPAARRRIRDQQQIAADGVVFLYLGRLKVDKGILDLASAFASLARVCPEVWLLIVGLDEERLAGEVTRLCGTAKDRLRVVDHTDAPEDYMAASDVFCLPSYREGFNTAILEAASVGLPAIASNIYGISDAIESGKTGLLHEPRDRAGIQTHMALLASDAKLRNTMGQQAQIHAGRYFSAEIVSSALLDFYGSVVDGQTHT